MSEWSSLEAFILAGGQTTKPAAVWYLDAWCTVTNRQGWWLLIPSVGPGRDGLGDREKALQLFLLWPLQTFLLSVGPWLIPPFISRRWHKMSMHFFITRMQDKQSEVPIPPTHQGSWRNQHKIQSSKCYRRCTVVTIDASVGAGLACWTLRMSNFHDEIKCGVEENPSTLGRDLKIWTLAEGAEEEEMAQGLDCLAEELGLSTSPGRSLGTSLKEAHGQL